ncbi:ATP-grasp domain-containing protein [Rhodococcus aerolatus]
MLGRVGGAARTVGVLGLLGATLPVDLAVTGAALLRSAVVRPSPRQQESPRTVLVSGGKMTKALVLARAFHADGHRVVLVEQEKYRLTGHRFSAAVDVFRTVPKPDDPGYTDALVQVCREEGVDVYVPVCSPVASYHDALAKDALEAAGVEVVHLGPEDLHRVDDKSEFAALAASLGLRVPDTHRITDPDQVAAFDFAAAPGDTYVLKSIGYDPVRRLDLTPLPRETPEETAAYARTLPISDDNPWILQEFVRGQEYCTHGTARDGEVTVWACCESSASQINYAMVDRPDIEEWVRTFVRELGATGQLSFDFITDAAGDTHAIECNPRTHSAITMFYDQPDLARAYLGGAVSGGAPVVPTPTSRPTYWIYHELWRLLRDPRDARHRLGVIAGGTDAIFDWSDPLPFLMVHHLHVPSLLLANLVRGTGWVKIDLNIGKLVEPGGD